ncbi:AraC family transcriptional regulator [Marinilactibacillus kalidii]|uniref:AraC family transcriptional regulator n=1 Tax=Marinilactibacillus kalidii TaxID=2820274 RepID=UPI001ABE580C|nr:helix-turn-helix domain-containing protein [Marinilactibacillus kalidii]
MQEIVYQYLYNYNSIEKKQRLNGDFIIDLPEESFLYTDGKMVLKDQYFLKNDQIYISKHNRFAKYPEHTHQFLEVNYMLKGECRQTINGEQKILKEGELLLLDYGSTHAIEPLRNEDILINIIFPQTRFDLNWLSQLNTQDSSLFQFLVHAVSEKSKGQYIIFESSHNQSIRFIMIQMLNKYFTESTFSNEIISYYLPILFMELVGNTKYRLDVTPNDDHTNKVIIEVLKKIKLDFKTISLEQLASQLNYSNNYLSEIIKEKTGKTFVRLVTEERLKRAKFLIESTNLPIEEICQAIGLQNKSYFYRIFRDMYAVNPGAYRKSKAQDL